jgi:hypothetical protein
MATMQPHCGPVVLTDILRKYRAPPPRSSDANSRRPRTADGGSVYSVRSVGSIGSNYSGASTTSFVDRFAGASRKEQRLLMMQKKLELNEAMQKKVQIDQRVRFPPCFVLPPPASLFQLTLFLCRSVRAHQTCCANFPPE